MKVMLPNPVLVPEAARRVTRTKAADAGAPGGFLAVEKPHADGVLFHLQTRPGIEWHAAGFAHRQAFRQIAERPAREAEALPLLRKARPGG